MKRKLSDLFLLLSIAAQFCVFGIYCYTSWTRERASSISYLNPFGYIIDFVSILTKPISWFFIGTALFTYALSIVLGNTKYRVKQLVGIGMAGLFVSLLSLRSINDRADITAEIPSPIVNLTSKQFEGVRRTISEIETGVQTKTLDTFADTELDRSKFQKSILSAGLTLQEGSRSVYWNYIVPLQTFRKVLLETMYVSARAHRPIQSASLKFLGQDLLKKRIITEDQLKSFDLAVDASAKGLSIPSFGLLNEDKIKTFLNASTRVEVYLGKVIFGDEFNPREIRQFCPIDCDPIEISKAKISSATKSITGGELILDVMYNPYDADSLKNLRAATLKDKNTKILTKRILEISKFRSLVWKDALYSYLQHKEIVSSETKVLGEQLLKKGSISMDNFLVAMKTIKSSADRQVAGTNEQPFVPSEGFLRDSFNQAIMDQVILERALGLDTKDRKTASSPGLNNE